MMAGGLILAIRSNEELRQAVNKAVEDSGYKKMWIAQKMGISRQAFTNFMNKSNFSIDDANKILTLIGVNLVAEIHKNDEK